MTNDSVCNHLELILNAITDGVVMVNALGKVSYCNSSAERIFERELLGKTLAIPINISITTPQEINLVRPSGLGWAELRSAEIEWQGEPAYVILIRDITETKLNEDKLLQAAAVFENTRDGVMTVDANLRIIHINQAFTDITGYTAEEALGKPSNLLRSGRHDAEFYKTMWDSLKTTGHWQGEIWNRRKNNEVYPELLSISAVTDKSGSVTNYVGVFADISKLKASEIQLDFLAHHDPLTGLPNRLLLLSHLEHAIKMAQRENSILAVLMLDLDRFKEVNDVFGHLAGDELLQQVAQRLISRLRAADTVCRLGGDEFVILLESITQIEDAALVANDIITTLSEPWQLSKDIEVGIGASVGIALYPEHSNQPEQLLQQADTALYQAKSEGRGCFKYFSESITEEVRLRMDMEMRLRHGIVEHELCVFYQPQIEITTGKIIGVEALVRWQDPVYGLILPSAFIELAEKTGLIARIGSFVLKQACEQGQRWLNAGMPLMIAVNISTHQFRYSQIDKIVASVLEETGFPAQYLTLELTESALMQREKESIVILKRLHALGVQLAIDNFGTGYSSIAHLRSFPLTEIKIDRCFIHDMIEQTENQEIIKTMISIAHALKLKVLAEGVETSTQLDFLKQQRCDLYQGFLTSPALAVDEFEKFISGVQT